MFLTTQHLKKSQKCFLGFTLWLSLWYDCDWKKMSQKTRPLFIIINFNLIFFSILNLFPKIRIFLNEERLRIFFQKQIFFKPHKEAWKLKFFYFIARKFKPFIEFLKTKLRLYTFSTLLSMIEENISDSYAKLEPNSYGTRYELDSNSSAARNKQFYC